MTKKEDRYELSTIVWKRKELGLTRNDLAKAVGISPKTLKKIENGKIKCFDYAVVKKLAKELGVGPLILALQIYPTKIVDGGTVYLSSIGLEAFPDKDSVISDKIKEMKGKPLNEREEEILNMLTNRLENN